MKHGLLVIGYGGMGKWHVSHAQKSDVVSLVGIYDIDEEKRNEARKNGIFAYETLEEALSDEKTDIVTVAIPNDCHPEVVIKALKSGKNVICEKPAAITVAEFDEMTKVARESGKMLTVHQNRRWDVDFLAIKKLYEENSLGEIFNIESRIHGSRGIPSDWRREKNKGGGMILDWGVHLIDQILCLKKEGIKRIYCDCTHITTHEVDDGFRLEIVFEDNCRAYIEVGTYNFLPHSRFYVQGKEGTAKIVDWREQCTVTHCDHWHESEVLPVETSAGLTKTMAPRNELTTTTYSVPIPSSDVHDFYRNFCNAIDGKEELFVTPEQVRRVLYVMEQAFISDDRHETLKFEKRI